MTIVNLIAKEVMFYSEGDEESFFARLREIKAISKIFGKGNSIVIVCDSDLMSDASLRELIAILFRYGIDTRQLDIFATKENQSWLLNDNAYWRKR